MLEHGVRAVGAVKAAEGKAAVGVGWGVGGCRPGLLHLPLLVPVGSDEEVGGGEQEEEGEEEGGM